MRLGAKIPDFSANTTLGPIKFHEWIGNSWCMLFSHPADFTPVCTTELGRIAVHQHEFKKRNVKIIALSCDKLKDHCSWVNDIKSYCRDIPGDFPYPIISDETRELAVKLDMLDEKDQSNPDTAMTVRSLYIIDPDKKLRLAMIYPVSTGRNVDEILRVIDSLQLTDRLKVIATPANWVPGEKVMILPNVKDEDLAKLFPNGVDKVSMPSGQNYTTMILGDEFPNFEAETTQGHIQFHDWLGNSWCIFFSHPNAFTPVCTTELGRVAQLVPEFEKRNVKVMGCSCDTVDTVLKWITDINSYSKLDKFPYPIVGDESRTLAVKLGMMDPEEKDKEGIPVTCRAVFIIDPNKKIRLSILYPATTGRNFTEILRVVDSLQLTDTKSVATPADWKYGEHCMILPSVSDEKANELFPSGFVTVQVPSGKEYIRKTRVNTPFEP